MFKIDGDKIYLTKGDWASISVSMKDDSGNAYTMQTGDTLTLSVRTHPNTGDLIFSSSSSSSTIIVMPAATEEKTAGKYSADIQLETADGKVVTVWPSLSTSKDGGNWKNFILMGEVTLNG